jgi:hypothetical protein
LSDNTYHAIYPALLENEENHWDLSPLTPRVFKAVDATGKENPVAVKKYATSDEASREFNVLHALRDFGMNLGPEPLDQYQNIVVMSWLDGHPLDAPPAPADESMWHRLMAATGAAGEMRLGPYSRQVPSQGKGFYNPVDMMDAVERELSDENDPAYEQIHAILERMREQITPQWERPVPVGLCRLDHDLNNLLWDGHHLLATDWDAADWGDVAADIGMWSAHPDYEDVPSTHWVWVRWEFARLVHDQTLVPRATVYSRIAQVWWAAHLEPSPRRDRYIKRAEKAFR